MNRFETLGFLLGLTVATLIVVSLVFWEVRRRKQKVAQRAEFRKCIALLGVPQTSLEPGEMKTIELVPQRLFRAVAYGRFPLIVPHAISLWFEIDDLCCAGDSVFVSAAPIPAEAFSDRFGREGLRDQDQVAWPALQIGQTIRIGVRNTDAVRHTFMGYVTGVFIR